MAAGLLLCALAALHPPWNAQAVLYRVSFRGFPQVPPTTVIDTVHWSLPFAPWYRRPVLDLPEAEYAAYQRRLQRGDFSAADEWRARIEELEARNHVPQEIRSRWARGGSADPRSAVAFRRTIIDWRFDVAVRKLATLLAGILAATAIAVAAITFFTRKSYPER